MHSANNSKAEKTSDGTAFRLHQFMRTVQKTGFCVGLFNFKRSGVALAAPLRFYSGCAHGYRNQYICQFGRLLHGLLLACDGKYIRSSVLRRNFPPLHYRNRKSKQRLDRHETIVAERCETFRYCHIGGMGITSAELKHRAKLQEWSARIHNQRNELC